MAVRNMQDTTITFIDAAAANSLVVTVEEGDFSFTERQPVNMITDRGILDHWRKGSEVPCEWSMSVKFSGVTTGNGTGVANVGLYEFLTKTGGASGFTGTQDTISDVWTLDMNVLWTAPEVSGGTSDTADFQDNTIDEISISEAEDYSVLTISGRSLSTRPAWT